MDIPSLVTLAARTAVQRVRHQYKMPPTCAASQHTPPQLRVRRLYCRSKIDDETGICWQRGLCIEPEKLRLVFRSEDVYSKNDLWVPYTKHQRVNHSHAEPADNPLLGRDWFILV